MIQVALIGGSGQLGHDLLSLLERGVGGMEVAGVARGSGDLDVCDRSAIENFVSETKPDVLISTAAYNRVDDCEWDQAGAFAVNALGSRYLAEACGEHDIRLVWFSTDFVFDGTRGIPYVEDDTVAPVNLYGCSKAAGELLIRATLDRHIIVRTSSLYGVAGSRGKGGNFVKSILAKLSEGESPVVVDDLVMSPTYTNDLAESVVDILHSGETGTFHVANAGSCTWHEFASEIARQSGYSDIPVLRQSARGSRGAKRPAYSALASSRRSALRSWEEALAAYLEETAKRAIL